MRLLLTAALFSVGMAALAAAAPGDTASQLERVPPEHQRGTAACWADYDAVGIPYQRSEDQETVQRFACHQRYAVSISTETHNPDWVMEHLTRARLRDNGAVRGNRFIDDPAFPTDGSHDVDYRGAAYQRGHQAPAEDFRSNQTATDHSFQMSNMAPQVGPGFNGSQWKLLEEEVRAWVTCGGHEDIIVITGPIYTGRAYYMVAGSGTQRHTTDVRVPDAFFKIVYDLRSGQAVGFRLPHEARIPRVAVSTFVVPISLIEDQTGLDFFHMMPRRRQTQIESNRGIPWAHIARCAAES